MKFSDWFAPTIQVIGICLPLAVIAITTYQASEKAKADDFALVESYAAISHKLEEYLLVALDGPVSGENKFSRSKIIGQNVRVLSTLDVNRLRKPELATAFLDITILGAESLAFVDDPSNTQPLTGTDKARIIRGIHHNLKVIDAYIKEYKDGK